MFRFLFVFMCLAGLANAQTYPEYRNTTVNDVADLLDPPEEAALSDRLTELERETGVEMTVLTLSSQSGFAPDQTLEQFATGLFNHWGIGKAERDDGVLVLILRDDRAMRIELGRAYGRGWDHVARGIVDAKFLPAFRAEDYPKGIMEGSDAIIDEIVLPFRDGQAAPAKPEGGDLPFWMFLAFGGLVVLSKGQRVFGDQMVRLRACPSCGRRGLRRMRETEYEATPQADGLGVRTDFCVHCDHEDRSTYAISHRSKSGSGGFGGGRSGGGGASGRW